MGTWGMIRGPARVERERAVKRDGIFFYLFFVRSSVRGL